MSFLKSSRFVLVFLSLFLLGGCGNSENKNQPIDLPDQAATILDSLDELKGKVDLPPLPDEEEGKIGIVGIDTNSNGVRDDIETLFYQSINYNENAPSEFNKLLELARLFQPPLVPKPKSINEIDIVCFYRTLSPETRRRLSYGLIEDSILNTKERFNLFKISSVSINDTSSTCD